MQNLVVEKETVTEQEKEQEMRDTHRYTHTHTHTHTHTVGGEEWSVNNNIIEKEH